MKSLFIMRKKAKDRVMNAAGQGAPTPERIKQLWGIARKRVYFAIKLVERQGLILIVLN